MLNCTKKTSTIRERDSELKLTSLNLQVTKFNLIYIFITMDLAP